MAAVAKTPVETMSLQTTAENWYRIFRNRFILWFLV